ncbi:hypothetical protein ACP275_12G044900 [Erythranthe tilingii]
MDSQPTSPSHTTPIQHNNRPFIIAIIISILVIFVSLIALIIYLTALPRNSMCDVTSANFTIGVNPLAINLLMVVNISSPTRKLGVRFKALHIKLKDFRADVSLDTFDLKHPEEARLVQVLAQKTWLEPTRDDVLKLQQLEQKNNFFLHIKGFFNVMINTGLIRYTYWLHAECQLEMTSLPNSVMISRKCKTKI